MRQNKVEVIAELYFDGFGDFAKRYPDISHSILQPIYDRTFYEKNLALTRKTNRPIWRKI